MAKELPYFRFTCQEWDTGDISMESLSTKGLFIDVCSYYWTQNCSVTFDKLSKKIGKNMAKSPKIAANLLTKMENSGVIKIDGDYIRINFLDRQWDKLEKKHKILSDSGKKGVLARMRKRQATLKPPLSIKDNDNDKDNSMLTPEEEKILEERLSNAKKGVYK
jgi:hypothetical protein